MPSWLPAHPVLLLACAAVAHAPAATPRCAAAGRQLKVDAPLPTSCCTGTPVSVLVLARRLTRSLDWPAPTSHPSPSCCMHIQLSCNPAALRIRCTLPLLQGWWAGNGQELWRGSGGLTPDAEPPKAPSTGGFQLGTLFYSNQQITAMLQYFDPVRRASPDPI